MPGCYGFAMARGDLGFEKCVSEVSGFLLDIARVEGRRGYQGGDLKTAREFLYEGLVGVRLRAAQTVIYMQDYLGQPEFVEGVEEENGVGPAGNGYAAFLIRPGHLMPSDGGGDALDQGLDQGDQAVFPSPILSRRACYN